MSRIVVDSIRNSSASSDGITLASDGSVTIPGNATCSGTASGFGGGKILQVKQTLKQDTFSMSSSSSYTAVTGLSLSITPSSASNKILIFGTIYSSSPTDDYATVFALYKNGSAVSAAHGTPSGSRYGAAMKLRADGGGNAKHLHHEFLDTAGGTSAITYQYYMAAETTGYVGRTGNDGNSWYQARCPSIITAMEIEA
tara:strand:+ start:31 stop:624 length:594 start_codon:yes stop_codon:yes gene_type:complete